MPAFKVEWFLHVGATPTFSLHLLDFTQNKLNVDILFPV